MKFSAFTTAVTVLGFLSISLPFDSYSKGNTRGGSSGGSHSVRGYTKKDGTYVAPHRATNPDHTKRNNYSSKGNANPNTGKEGTKDPDRP